MKTKLILAMILLSLFYLSPNMARFKEREKNNIERLILRYKKQEIPNSKIQKICSHILKEIKKCTEKFENQKSNRSNTDPNEILHKHFAHLFEGNIAKEQLEKIITILEGVKNTKNIFYKELRSSEKATIKILLKYNGRLSLSDKKILKLLIKNLEKILLK